MSLKRPNPTGLDERISFVAEHAAKLNRPDGGWLRAARDTARQRGVDDAQGSLGGHRRQ